ncbi:MAG TPA: hypothetical protein VJ749_05210 [Pyrinomonadaceae bacterium]|nr:hypothetical protein [Pyrinomonadaceae bacterium]
MKTLLFLACLLVLSAFAVVSVNADIAKPKPTEQQSKVVMGRRLEIVPDAKVWQARLQISQSDFQELRAAVNGASGSNATLAANIAQSSTRTIVAGVLLFFSVSFAGVWLAQRSSATRRRKAIAAGVVVVAVLGAAAIITRGNAGPPPGYLSWKDLGKNFQQGKATAGQMMIEVVPDNADNPPPIRLLLPTKPKDGPADE